MDFTLFDKAHEQFSLVSGYIDAIKSETLKIKEQSTSLESAAEQMKMQKQKYSSLVEERDHLVMERELMRKRVEQMVREVDATLEQEAKK